MTEKKSCGYQGEVENSEITVGACVNGKCWTRKSNGYKDCLACAKIEKLKVLLEDSPNWREEIIKEKWGFKEAPFKDTARYAEFYTSTKPKVDISVILGKKRARLGKWVMVELAQYPTQKRIDKVIDKAADKVTDKTIPLFCVVIGLTVVLVILTEILVVFEVIEVCYLWNQ